MSEGYSLRNISSEDFTRDVGGSQASMQMKNLRCRNGDSMIGSLTSFASVGKYPEVRD